jgi:putative DNA primase/helicase
VSSPKRPKHNFVPCDIEPAVDAGLTALCAKGGVYISGPRLVHIGAVTKEQSEKSVWRDSEGRERRSMVECTPYIAPLAPAVLKMKLSSAIVYRRLNKKGDWNPCEPPDAVVGAIYKHENWGLPRLVGIAETPVLRPDGTIASERGYDAASGYFIDPRGHYEEVPETPTQEQARAAYAQLAEVFEDFPYARPGQAAVPISALLTVFARPCITGCVPCIVYDASAGGTGKTLQSDVVSIITTGRDAARQAYPTSEEETAKAIASSALRGPSLISIDDVKRPLGGATLDMVTTTTDTLKIRILGQSEEKEISWRALIQFTGVNIGYVGQMSRRVLVARLESDLEKPQDRRDFKHWPLRPWVATERARLVVAALTVLRAYIAAGKPKSKDYTWGSFDEWAGLIAGAIEYAGGPNVLAFRVDDRTDNNEEDDDLVVALDGLERFQRRKAKQLKRDPQDGVTAAEIAEIFSQEWLGDFDTAPLRDALRALTRTQPAQSPNGRRIGMALGRNRARVLRAGDRLLRLSKAVNRSKVGSDRWVVEQVEERSV